ncbi:MAG: hypothetical protein ABSH20_12850, partial [Tepidisphaeraceae bacterium]
MNNYTEQCQHYSTSFWRRTPGIDQPSGNAAPQNQFTRAGGTDRDGRKPTQGNPAAEWIAIYDSELRVMAGLAAQAGNREVGGALFGLQTHGGRFVVSLATGPGDGATQTVASFQMRPAFMDRVGAILHDLYGLQWIGNHHSHHMLDIGSELSGTDLRQVMSLARDNGFERWCSFLATTHRPTTGHKGWSESGGDSEACQIRLTARMFHDAQAGARTRVRIRVLPGISPIRLSLLANGRLSPQDIAEQASAFPPHQIRLDCQESPTAAGGGEPAESTWLARQVAMLPLDVQPSVKARKDGSMLVLRLPLRQAPVAFVAIDADHQVRGIRLVGSAGGSGFDVTPRILAAVQGPELELGRLHAALSTLAADGGTICKAVRQSPQHDGHDKSQAIQSTAPATARGGDSTKTTPTQTPAESERPAAQATETTGIPSGSANPAGASVDSAPAETTGGGDSMKTTPTQTPAEGQRPAAQATETTGIPSGSANPAGASVDSAPAETTGGGDSTKTTPTQTTAESERPAAQATETTGIPSGSANPAGAGGPAGASVDSAPAETTGGGDSTKTTPTQTTAESQRPAAQATETTGIPSGSANPAGASIDSAPAETTGGGDSTKTTPAQTPAESERPAAQTTETTGTSAGCAVAGATTGVPMDSTPG